MQDILNTKVLAVINPAAVNDNAAFTANYVDTNGFGWASFYFHFGAMDIAMAVLKMTECDTSGGSYTDITGASFAAAAANLQTDGTAASLPSATDDNHLFAIHVKLGGKRNRYLKPSATAGDGAVGTYMSAFCILSRAAESPYTIAGRGVTQEIVIT